MARNFSVEIIEKQKRQNGKKEHEPLENLTIDCQSEEYNKEFLKYIPVVTTAYMETSIRAHIAYLIDFGSPYNTNLIAKQKDLFNNLKIDFDVLNRIQGKEYTFGTFVSHIISFSDYAGIESKLSIILGSDFTNNLKTFKNSKSSNIVETANKFINNADKIIADIDKMFKLRHIIAHEFPTKALNREELIQYLDSCSTFIYHTNNYIWRLLQPIELVTQADMNNYAYGEYETAKNELDDLIEKIKNTFTPEKAEGHFHFQNLDSLDKSMKLWREYTDFHVRAKYKANEGGSIWKYLYSSDMAKHIKDKTNELSNEFKYLFE